MEPLATVEWTVEVPAGAPLDRIVVDFAVTRTRLVRVTLGDGVAHDLTCKGHRAEATLTGIVLAQTSTLRVLYTGDTPHIAKIYWQSSQPTALPIVVPAESPVFQATWLGDTLLDFAVPVHVAGPGEFDIPQPLDIAEAFELRRQGMREDYGARCFFAALDELTSDTKVEPKVRDLSSFLRSRVERRGVFARQGCPAVPLFPGLLEVGDDGLPPALARVSALFWCLARHHLGGGVAELAAWAFDLFSTNSLAVAHRDYDTHRLIAGHGAPDGIQFLFFTELAFTCIAEKVDDADWKLLLPTLVRATEQFLDVRRAHAGTGTMAPPSYPMPDEWQVARSRSERLKVYYHWFLSNAAIGDPLTALEDRFSWLVGSALFGQTGWPSGRSRPLQPWPPRQPARTP